MIAPLRIIIVDDEQLSREMTVQQLLDTGHDAWAASDGPTALAEMRRRAPDVVLTDLRMPGMDGLHLLRAIKQEWPDVDVIVMTAYGTVESAVAAMHDGAIDYITKPFRFPELSIRLQRIAEHRATRSELQRLRQLLGAGDQGPIIGRAPLMRQAGERAALYAEHDAPVLITGETGTGKEVVARAIHELGPRRERPFVALACGAIPESLAESQLFGHEKGAFTGASQRRVGCFERADRGTLLLDDLDDLPLEVQVKLLRVLQEGAIQRVGGDEVIEVDVRVIATTKIDLEEAVAAHRFRDDLYYRLRGLEIHLPPLRDRGDDILLLAQHFITKLSPAPQTLSPDAAGALRRHPWPGNVRELERVIESALVLATEGAIDVGHLPDSVQRPHEPRLFAVELDAVDRVDLHALVHEFEDEVISWAMARAGGQQTRAAEILGLPRTSLQSKLGRRHED